MFSLNSIEGVQQKKAVLLHSEGNTKLTDVCGGQRAQIFIQKDRSNILTARWRASAWSDKMNKEQSADDPSVDLIRVKNML